jgi:hypothetical protein
MCPSCFVCGLVRRVELLGTEKCDPYHQTRCATSSGQLEGLIAERHAELDRLCLKNLEMSVRFRIDVGGCKVKTRASERK